MQQLTSNIQQPTVHIFVVNKSGFFWVLFITQCDNKSCLYQVLSVELSTVMYLLKYGHGAGMGASSWPSSSGGFSMVTLSHVVVCFYAHTTLRHQARITLRPFTARPTLRRIQVLGLVKVSKNITASQSEAAQAVFTFYAAFKSLQSNQEVLSKGVLVQK